MDPSLYRTFQVSRGYTYRYFYSPAKDTARTILFLHGFPNAETDWRHQVSFFQAKGYGLVVPSLLGYGGTSKPTDPAAYRQSLITKDLIEILDKEGVDKVIAIGHDWGTNVASRFALFHPQRTEAVAFITCGYIPPSPPGTGPLDLRPSHQATKERFGYEVLGYWEFLVEPDAPRVCMENFERFFNLFWADDTSIVSTEVAPLGALRRNIEGTKPFPASRWMSEEDKRLISEPLLLNGLEAPVCYYRVQMDGLARDDDELLGDKKEIPQPVFFLDALDDLITCEEKFVVATTGQTESPVAKYCKNATIKRVNVDHWVLLRIPDEVNEMLWGWMATF